MNVLFFFLQEPNKPADLDQSSKEAASESKRNKLLVDAMDDFVCL